LLRLLKQTVAAGAQLGKPISVCGDMAGDPLCTWLLVGLGIRDLSMAPGQIPSVKSIVSGTRLAEAEALVAEALNLPPELDLRELVTARMLERFPLEVAG